MSTMAATNDRPSKPFSLSFGSRSKPATAKVTPKKRSYATLTADDSDEDQDAPLGKAQLVHSFDQAAGGAVGLNKKEEKEPLVIVSQKNLDWREEARRRRGGANILPAEELARRAGVNSTDDGNMEQKEPVYGLVVADKTQNNGDVQMEEVKVEMKPKSADEEALDALLGKKESTLVIERVEQEDALLQSRTNDTHAFRADIASRPDSASLADYEAVPIEDFGLALLRGQGYRPGDPIGRRKTAAPVVPRVPQKRANLLGIGAKEVPEGMEELGAWGKGTKKKGNKIDRSYNPLVLRNKETGEVLTEAELQARKEQQSLVLEDVQEKKSRRHRDYDDEKYESSRHSSSRRDRSRPRDRKERRDKDYDRDRQDKDDKRSRRERDYDDSDYDRRKDRKTYQDDNHGRRERQDRDDYKSSRDKDGSRHERQKDDYEDRRHKEKRRDDRR